MQVSSTLSGYTLFISFLPSFPSFHWPDRNKQRWDIFFPYYNFIKEDNFCHLSFTYAIDVTDVCISNF